MLLLEKERVLSLFRCSWCREPSCLHFAGEAAAWSWPQLSSGRLSLCEHDPDFWLISGLSYAVIWAAPFHSSELYQPRKIRTAIALFKSSKRMLLALIPKVVELPPSGVVSRAAVMFPPWSSPSVHWELGLGSTHTPGKDCVPDSSGVLSALLTHQSTQRSCNKNKNASLLAQSPITLNLSEFTNLYWVTIIITVMNVFVGNVVPGTSPLFIHTPSRKANIFFNPGGEIGCGKSPIETVSTVLYEWKVLRVVLTLLPFTSLLMLEPSSHPSCHSTISFPFGHLQEHWLRSWFWVLLPGVMWGSHPSVTYRRVWGSWAQVEGVSKERFQTLLSLRSECFFPCLVYIYYGRVFFWKRCY